MNTGYLQSGYNHDLDEYMGQGIQEWTKQNF